MKVYLTDGTLPTYFDNGKKSGEVTYKNNKPHGLWTEWYENGQHLYCEKSETGVENCYMREWNIVD